MGIYVSRAINFISDPNYIDTIPPTPGNEIATGYPYFTVTAQLRTDYTVVWYYGERQQYTYTVSYFGVCLPLYSNDVNITCMRDYSGAYRIILTNLTYIGPLSEGVLQTAIEEDDFYARLTLPTKTIRGKSKNFVSIYITGATLFKLYLIKPHRLLPR